MIGRITANGLLELNMRDMQRGVTFREATLQHVRSQEAVRRAAYVILFSDGDARILKAKRPVYVSRGGIESKVGTAPIVPELTEQEVIGEALGEKQTDPNSRRFAALLDDPTAKE